MGLAQWPLKSGKPNNNHKKKIGFVPHIVCLLQKATLGLYSQSTITIKSIDNAGEKVSVPSVCT